MVYAKFIKKNGKKIGPYYYRSVRLPNGKVKSVYIGKNPPKDFRKPSRFKPFGPVLKRLLSSLLS